MLLTRNAIIVNIPFRIYFNVWLLRRFVSGHGLQPCRTVFLNPCFPERA
jgi:hypothetical protein